MRALPRRDLWLMGLWAAVLPALGLLVLVRRVAERLQPGSGTAAAAVLAFGSLLLPFSSVFFSHALAAFLGFGAFALLLRRPRTAARAGAAGLLAGAGVLVEYPSAILAALLGVYVLRSAYPVSARVGAAFASGAALGPACLLVFNQLAYGSPFHLSYVGAVLHPGASGHDVLGANSTGFFGVTVPKLHRLTEILIGSQGLLTLGPVLTLVPVGWLLLWRRGLRQESALLATVVAVFVFYNVCYYSPLGGATPGPRFLIVALPFAVAALAPVLVRFGWQTLVLTAPSVVFLVSAHLTQPLISKPYSTEDWWTWIREGSFTMTVLRPGSHTLLPVVPIMLAAASALAGAALSLQRAKLDAATTNAAGPQYTGDPRRAQGGG